MPTDTAAKPPPGTILEEVEDHPEHADVQTIGRQSKAEIMEHAMKQITTQHVHDVLDFTKTATHKPKKTAKGEHSKKAKRSKSQKHTPAQLRVLQRKRASTVGSLGSHTTKSRDLQQQTFANRLRHLRQKLLPVPLDEYIRL